MWDPFSDIWHHLWHLEPFHAFRIGCFAKIFNGWLPLNVFAGWLCPACVTGTWVTSWIDVILIWYHYIVICTLVTIFNWWLSSKDMKLRVLIKEVLVVFHWLAFRIIYIIYIYEIYVSVCLYKNLQLLRDLLTVYIDENRKLIRFFFALLSVWLVLYCICNIFCWIFPGSKILIFVSVKQKDYFRNSLYSFELWIIEYKNYGHIKLLESIPCVVSIVFYSCREEHCLEMSILEMNMFGWRLKKKTIRQ